MAGKVRELDQKMLEVNRSCDMGAGSRGGDNSGGSDGRRIYYKNISEFKAIQFLEKYTGDTRAGFKT